MFKPSPQQAAIFDWIENGTGNGIIEAVAGSGKTTTLVQGVDRMQGSVIFLAFNKKIVEELKTRIGDRANTFHSVGFRALRTVLKTFPQLDAKKVKNICAALNLPNAVAPIVGMAKNRLLLPDSDSDLWQEMIEHYGLLDDLPEDTSVEQAIMWAKRVLVANNANTHVIDFDDQLYLPLILNARFQTYDWVLIDEAQDTNPARRAIAQKMLGPRGRCIAVGDPRQAIYGFTGTDNDSLSQVAKSFGAVTMPLTVSYRCPKSVVKHAQQWVSHIESAPNAPEGSVETVDAIRFRQVLTNGDAVLCRYTKPLVELCFALIREGRSAKIEGRSIGEQLAKFATKWKVKSLDVLRDRIDKHFAREIEKATEKKKDAQLDLLNDQYATLHVLLERAENLGLQTTEAFRDMILSIFTDEAGFKGILLCSVHRSKGLEWDRVFLLDRETHMPSKYARQEWQMDQEINLIYVAVTRAKKELYEVVTK